MAITTNTLAWGECSDRVVQAANLLTTPAHRSLLYAFGLMADQAKAVNTTIEQVALDVLDGVRFGTD
ncbi:MAG: hypothetical protein ACLPVY_16190 [Acidimicrobiia bacterium]